MAIIVRQAYINLHRFTRLQIVVVVVFRERRVALFGAMTDEIANNS